MRAVTGLQMGMIDKYSIEQLGIPGAVLMENAALKVVKHIELYFRERPYLCQKVLIFAGKGNNGGDAFAVARHLKIKNYDVKVYCLFDEVQITGDARLNLNILCKLNIKIEFIKEQHDYEQLKELVENSPLIVDGIFGTGFRGEVQGYIAQTIQVINHKAKYVISIDIASGTDSASGKAADNCIKADKTVTFQLPKIGQLIYPGAYYTGELAIEEIGMPEQAMEGVAVNTYLSECHNISKMIPKRNADLNKGTCGKVAIVTGSSGMAGSGCLASKAALKTGSGLVYTAVPSSMLNIYQTAVPEAIAIGLDDQNGVLAHQSTDKILEIIKKCDVAAIGPGLSDDKCIYYILRSISDKINNPVVLDADALNVISEDISILRNFKAEVVITPHPGEMARLTGLEISYIQQNRLEVAKEYSNLWGITVVLKGAGTIIAAPDGTAYINPTGNAGMATAGSGDSLTGIITSLLGQGAKAFEAAVAGVYIHGLAGDLAAAEKGEYGITAMDIVEHIPYAMKKLLGR